MDISVLLPIYGEAPYLEMTLNSIEMEKNTKIEIVLILDRPTTKQIDRINDLVLRFPESRILISPLPGISNALNFGLENCLGTYVARIDSDDEMISSRLGVQRKFLEKNPKVSCVGTQVIKINDSNQIVGKSRYPTNSFYIRRLLQFRNCVAHPTTMYKRADVLRVGGYRSQFDGAEDYDLWLRLIRIGQIVNLSEPLTRYRIWHGQDSADYKLRMLWNSRIVNSFSWIERKKPELVAKLFTNDSNLDNIGVLIEQTLRNHYPWQWYFQEIKYNINFHLSFRSDYSALKVFLKILIQTLILTGRTVYLHFSRKNEHNQK